MVGVISWWEDFLASGLISDLYTLQEENQLRFDLFSCLFGLSWPFGELTEMNPRDFVTMDAVVMFEAMVFCPV